MAVNREYWRCRNGTIFCGSRYYVRARLCGNCYDRAARRRRGQAAPGERRFPRVWYAIRQRENPRSRRRTTGGRAKCPRWGAAEMVVFSGAMYADGKNRKLSYARWIYERAFGPLPDELVVVALRGGVPRLEDLIVVRRSETRHGVDRHLRELDLRAGYDTPF